MAIGALIPVLAPILVDIVRKVIPDKDAAAKAEQEAYRALSDRSADLEQAAASIINTEAASKHWLAANWRPVLMLTFGSLIVARWFGWAAPNLSESEYLALWDIVELGIGGYVIGRSAEKTLPAISAALATKGKR